MLEASCTERRAPHAPAGCCTEDDSRKCWNPCYLVKLRFGEPDVGRFGGVIHMLQLLLVLTIKLSCTPSNCCNSFFKCLPSFGLVLGVWAGRGGDAGVPSSAPPRVSLDHLTVPSPALPAPLRWQRHLRCSPQALWSVKFLLTAPGMAKDSGQGSYGQKQDLSSC